MVGVQVVIMLLLSAAVGMQIMDLYEFRKIVTVEVNMVISEAEFVSDFLSGYTQLNDDRPF
jgi:hypothetical protein